MQLPVVQNSMQYPKTIPEMHTTSVNTQTKYLGTL
jgi:hypothetical protein